MKSARGCTQSPRETATAVNMSTSKSSTVLPATFSMTNQLTVQVLFFGAARDAVGRAEIALNCDIDCTAGKAFQKILSENPALNRFGKSLLLAVNQEYADHNRVLRNGDELAIFPPVSGGSAGSAGILAAS